MQTDILTSYVEKVFAWAIKRTGDRMQAEDLAQQIMLEAVKSLPSLRQEDAFHAWLWGVAANVHKRWLHKEQQDRYFQERYFGISLAEVDMMLENDVIDPLLQEEEKSQIIRSVAMLSKQWRDITIMHYYDGLSVAEIASRLGSAEGTVKWQLSEARQRVRGQMQRMDEAPRKTAQPVKLRVSMGGIGGNPWPPSFVSRSLTQNIVLATNEEALTVEEIGQKIGVPAFYVEDEVRILTNRELMRQVGNRYQTDFTIMRYAVYKAIDAVLSDMGEALAQPLVKEMLEAKKAIVDTGYYTAGKSYEEQLWTLLPFAFKEAHGQTAIPSSSVWDVYPRRKDGGRWLVHGYELRDIKRCCISQNMCGGYRGRVLLNFYSISNVCDSLKFVGHADLPARESVELLYDLFINQLDPASFTDDMREQLSVLLERRLLRRDGNSLRLNVLYLDRQQYEQLCRIIGQILDRYAAHLLAMQEQVGALLKQAIPAHLAWQVPHYAESITISMGAGFIMRAAYMQGLLKPPQDPLSTGVFLLERSR